MTYRGKVQNGAVVLDDGVCLPDGTEVRIEVVRPRAADEASPDPRPIGKKLLELAERANELGGDLPADFAVNHDHYLYGTPKSE